MVDFLIKKGIFFVYFLFNDYLFQLCIFFKLNLQNNLEKHKTDPIILTDNLLACLCCFSTNITIISSAMASLVSSSPHLVDSLYHCYIYLHAQQLQSVAAQGQSYGGENTLFSHIHVLQIKATAIKRKSNTQCRKSFLTIMSDNLFKLPRTSTCRSKHD